YLHYFLGFCSLSIILASVLLFLVRRQQLQIVSTLQVCTHMCYLISIDPSNPFDNISFDFVLVLFGVVALMLEFIGIEGLKYWCSRDLEVAGFIVSFLYKDSCRFIRIVFYYYYTF
ncbi:hypothetical protein LINGRAHAP2_LOCUS31657, partial [Linum grandiflorum]